MTMGRLRRGHLELALALLASGCAKSHVVTIGDAGPGDEDAAVDAAGPVDIDAGCGDGTTLPPSLACTGLYLDIGSKQVSAAVRAFAPAVPLWSDGADKHRWIALPEGTQIDARDPSQWTFPVGTKTWKEFRVNGRRVETRFFHKVREDRWLRAAYIWNEDESDAAFSYGEDVVLADGSSYHVPTQVECDECHKGRRDRVLGFEMISLGADGAEGTTLAMLVEEGLLSPAPSATRVNIPDDGTGASGPALGWLHINCGVTCHNNYPNATGYGTGLRLQLTPEALVDNTPSAWEPLATTVNVRAITPKWRNFARIVPGKPDQSLIVRLISTRGDGEQMPPLASTKVDEQALAWVRTWIARMPHGEPADSGMPDAATNDGGADASVDGGPDTGDAALPDAGDAQVDASEAQADAATAAEAGAEDSGAADAEASAP